MTFSKDLIDAGVGAVPCDLNLANCSLVDLLRGEIRKDVTVSIRKGSIAGIDDGLRATRVIDLKGMYLAPGLVDSHVHIESSMLTPPEYARIVAPRGTTAVVADPHEIANVMGYEGMRYMLASSEGLPIDVYFMVPSCVPATDFDTAGAALYASDMHPFLREPRVLGLGEVMNYPGVLYKDQKLLDKIALFRDAGKSVDGHAPGLTGGPLSAYIAAGIGSDHECTTPAEALEKLSKGMYVMLREGSTARDLVNLIPAISASTASRFLICSDDRHPNDLKKGHLNLLVRKAIKMGVSPVDAIRAVTLNAAECFGMKNLGAIAPGYEADIAVVDNLKDFNVKMVFYRGEIVAKDGVFAGKPVNLKVPIRSSVNVRWLIENDFEIPAKGNKINLIDIVPGQLITKKSVADVKEENGKAVADTKRDILKLVVVERHQASGQIGKAFVRGFGLKSGAIASSVAHDSHNIIAVGADDESIYTAIVEVIKMGGGLSAAKGNKVLGKLPLPIAGLMSDRPLSEVAGSLEALTDICAGLGAKMIIASGFLERLI